MCTLFKILLRQARHLKTLCISVHDLYIKQAIVWSTYGH